MHLLWKNLFIFGIISQNLLLGQTDFSNYTESNRLPTYFHYNPAMIQVLSTKYSSSEMSNDEWIVWDDVAKALARKTHIGSDVYRMYAYLYTAQKEVAALSYNAHSQFLGSLGPISSKVLQLFFPSVPLVSGDEYSELLANLVLEKIQERLQDENEHIINFPITSENDPQLIDHSKPHFGLEIASWKPWILKNPLELIAPPPPPQDDSFWNEQAEIVKTLSLNNTPQQYQANQYWAGEVGPKSGEWLAIASDYMLNHHIPFMQIVCIRAILAESAIDGDISLFYSKYLYHIKRPKIINPDIFQHVPLPKHPSYPSGHSTISYMSAVILSNFFPHEKKHWFRLAEEAGQSRIWGGIHFPIDHEGGKILGMQLGERIIHSHQLCSRYIPSTFCMRVLDGR